MREPTREHTLGLAVGVMSLSMLLGSGCATTAMIPSITFHGAPRNSKEVVAVAQKMTNAEVADLPTLVGKLPAGVTTASGALQVDESRFELLGTVKATSTGPDFFVTSFYPYNEGESWRKGFCYWQVPLVWLTLATWSLYVPFHYPCKVEESNSTDAIEDRKERIITTLKKATKAMGGNLLIVTSLGSTKWIEAHSGTTVHTAEATQGEGFALRTKMALPTSEAAPPSSK